MIEVASEEKPYRCERCGEPARYLVAWQAAPLQQIWLICIDCANALTMERLL